jgi:hypothetical protein
MAERQMAHHLHLLHARLFAGKAQHVELGLVV